MLCMPTVFWPESPGSQTCFCQSVEERKSWLFLAGGEGPIFVAGWGGGGCYTINEAKTNKLGKGSHT